ncbi:MAG: UDP-N-acetylglucosamine--N-acetylmuramyl-(pentapeptide) pyrophosphoryl-undecaprenol N-acetylglucosamine transferase [Patescibacteria group bacterium]
MKILFTGGGSGGHFYPIIAVAQKLKILLDKEKIPNVKFFFMSTDPYNAEVLSDNEIEFKRVTAGKVRTYSSFENITDAFKTVWGIIKAFFQIFSLYPDIIFSKGGFASFPTLVAARFFRIPVIIHESDSVPGRVNLWAGKFAQKIAISYPEAVSFFPENKVALTGNPIRHELINSSGKNAWNELKLDSSIPVILILGGSLGSQKINDQFVTLSARLVEKYQIIHQTGERNFDEVNSLIAGLLGGNPNAARYHVFPYLDPEKLKLAFEAATIVISRSGSSVFEIAANQVPAILIPITESNGDHQRKNAFAYARAGGASVVEEANLAPNLLMLEIEHLLEDKGRRNAMKESAKNFARTDAAEKIAEQIVAVLLRHQI